MPRRKAAQNCRILPWLSRRADNSDGRFLQIGNSLLLSAKTATGEENNAFLRLSNGSKFVYLAMAMESGGRRDFEFPRTAALKYGISARTLIRAVDELESAGMLEIQSGRCARLPNRYRFVFDWKKPP